MNKKFVTFGEVMLRLNPEGCLRFVQADRFAGSYAGAEANVAVSLAQFGEHAVFVTKLPEHEIAQAACNAVRRYGVDVSHIVRGGPRLGVYFLEKGASQRPSKVIYDRAGSSIACAKRGDFDWAKILRGAGWFHFTGITAALGGELPAICRDALAYCRAHRITVSCDLNYRAKMWSREEAARTMGALVPHVDVLIANESDAADVFGISAPGSDVEAGTLDEAGYTAVAETLARRFGCKKVAITLRTSISASDNKWAGLLYDGKKTFFSASYPVHIVDRVGGGDSFGAGLIYALANGYAPQRAIDFAVAASCLKHAIESDFNLVRVEEVAALAAGNTSGRVQR